MLLRDEPGIRFVFIGGAPPPQNQRICELADDWSLKILVSALSDVRGSCLFPHLF